MEQRNNLDKENSLYLKSHAEQPVHWQAWRDELIAEAKKKNLPLFISIGYSTCHWCHVMARNTFAQQKVADILNQHFISIKIDREEHPEIDRRYMDFCQGTGRHCGWPLNIFATPDGSPLLSFTYLPPFEENGRKGLYELVLQLGEMWQKEPDSLLDSANKLQKFLQENATNAPADFSITIAERAQQIAAQVLRSPQGPQFPEVPFLEFLMNYADSRTCSETRSLLEMRLEAMQNRGLQDHVDGGFFRYSVDPQWQIPHFEKMLTDQALLLSTWLEAYQFFGKEKYLETGGAIVDFLFENMMTEGKFFGSALDAESKDNQGVKHEGYFYTFSWEDLTRYPESQLSEHELNYLKDFSGFSTDGNFREDPEKPTGENHITAIVKNDLKEKLKTLRSRRQKPQLDDKILTGWNAYTLAQIARYAWTQDNDALLTRSKDLFRQLEEQSTVDGKLQRILYYREEQFISGGSGDLSTYSLFALSSLLFYHITAKEDYLTQALRYLEEAVEMFRRSDNWFSDLAESTDKELKPDSHDPAVPSGNSLMLRALFYLGDIFHDEKLNETALELMRNFAGQLTREPLSAPYALATILQYKRGLRQVVLTGDTREFTTILKKKYLPYIYFLAPHQQLEHTLEMPRDATLAYLCEGSFCHPPQSSAEELFKILNSK